jgi:hypothetical protein
MRKSSGEKHRQHAHTRKARIPQFKSVAVRIVHTQHSFCKLVVQKLLLLLLLSSSCSPWSVTQLLGKLNNLKKPLQLLAAQLSKKHNPVLCIVVQALLLVHTVISAIYCMLILCADVHT